MTILTMLWLAVVLTGCNTFKGLGQDMQKAGEKIEDKAKQKQ